MRYRGDEVIGLTILHASRRARVKSDRYTKLVAWSDEDNCFIGTCPELFYGGCYGDDTEQVFAELCELAEEAIETLEEVGKPLPKPLSAEDLGKLLQRREARA